MKKNYGRTISILITLAMIGGIMLFGFGLFNLSEGIESLYMVESVFGVFIFVYALFVFFRRGSETKNYIDIMNDKENISSGNVLRFFPMPICIMNISGDIVWYNDKMTEMIGINDLYGVKIENVIPSLKWSSVIKSGKIERTTCHGGKQYRVFGQIITSSDRSDDDKDKYTVYLYFIDKTRESEIKRKYFEEHYDVALISVDNYE